MSYSPFTHFIETKGQLGVDKFLLADSNFDIEFQDNDKIAFGNDADATMYSSGSAFVIAPENFPVTIGHSSSTVTITGNLTVSGTTTTVDSTTLTVADPLIKTNKGDTASPARDQGFIISRGNGSSADADNRFMGWDESADQFVFADVDTEDGTTSGDITLASYANIKAGTIYGTLGTGSQTAITAVGTIATGTWQGTAIADAFVANDLTISGGTIDGSVYRGTTKAALSATTGTFSGVLKTDDATEATSTTDGSLQTDGGLSVVKDIVGGDDLILLTDSAVIHFGEHKEVTLTHVHDSGLTLKHTATADDKPITLTLATGETDMAADDVIGVINFQAPDEGEGTDAILVAAGIAAVSEGDFAAGSNATKLSFRTAASEAASEKMSLSSGGNLTVLGDIILDDGGSLKEAGGTAAITFDGSGNVTKIGQSTHTDGYFLKYRNDTGLAEWPAATVSSLACDDLSVGDAAVTISTSSGNITIDAAANDSDIIFKGTDNTSDITMLTLDGSEAGAATFNSSVTATTSVKATTVFLGGVETVASNTDASLTKAYTFVTSGSTGGDNKVTMTLPTTPAVGTTFTVIKVDAGTDRGDITCGGSDTIDGGTTIALYYQNESVTVVYGVANKYYIV